MTKLREMAYAQAVGEGLLMMVSDYGGDAPVLGAACMDEQL